MIPKIKFHVLSTLATFSIFVAVLGIKPASFLFWYQPEAPEQLRDNL